MKNRLLTAGIVVLIVTGFFPALASLPVWKIDNRNADESSFGEFLDRAFKFGIGLWAFVTLTVIVYRLFF